MGMKVNVTEALKLLAIRKGKTISTINKEMGFKSDCLGKQVGRGSIRMRVGAAVAEACGYKMVLIPEEVDVSEVDGIEIKGEVDLE